MTVSRNLKSPVRSFRDLVVWQKSVDLAEAIYIETRRFPKEEIYGLTAQMRRAAVSIASNLAEGHARQTRGEFVQFVGMARGSLAELQTQAILAARLQMFSEESVGRLDMQLSEVGRLLNALRTSVLTPSSSQPPTPNP